VGADAVTSRPDCVLCQVNPAAEGSDLCPECGAFAAALAAAARSLRVDPGTVVFQQVRRRKSRRRPMRRWEGPTVEGEDET
jgi:hypothetical protein